MEKKPIHKRIPTYVSVSKLLLDSKNYRLPEYAIKHSQLEIIDLYERDFDLQPIAQSMSDNGYFDEEPLIAIPGEKAETFIVVEGNRRLAALKLLTNSELRERSPNRDMYKKLAEDSIENLSEVPVIIHKNRDDLVAILGFRHISGIMRWGPREKARYIHDLAENRGPKADINEIASQLGSTPHHVRRNYATYRIYLQARDDFEIDVSKIISFSLFYRALGDSRIQKFLGFSIRGKDLKQLKAPISNKKSKALKEIIEFVHGTSEVKKLPIESRDITTLGQIIASPEALEHLRLSRSLKEAYSFTGGEIQSLIESLNVARYSLDESLRYVHRHKDDEKVAMFVFRCAARARAQGC